LFALAERRLSSLLLRQVTHVYRKGRPPLGWQRYQDQLCWELPAVGMAGSHLQPADKGGARTAAQPAAEPLRLRPVLGRGGDEIRDVRAHRFVGTVAKELLGREVEM